MSKQLKNKLVSRAPWLQFLLLCAFLCAAVADASSLEPVHPGQEASIIRAVFADSQLWLLTDAGTLSTIREGASERIDMPLDEPALDLWLQNGDAAVVTTSRETREDFTLQRWTNGAWTVLARLPAKQEQLIGVSGHTDGVTLLTSARLIDVQGGEYTVTGVAWPGKRGVAGVTAILSTPKYVLFGVNAGEWGGGLGRVDRKTGKVSVIESNISGDLCGGPLNSGCDPVNSIVAEPHRPDCAVIAIGLVHFSSHGRIDEVCGSRVRRLYFKAYDDDEFKGARGIGDEPLSTVAFFGLVVIDDELLAVGLDGIYRINADGTATVSSLPTFDAVGSLSVSFALPQVILLKTDVNERRSISGSVPMLVPR